MLINIYIANHGKRVGIEDYLSILGAIIARHGHEVVVSERLRPDLINIVIDEFTNFIRIEEIIVFRRLHPHVRLIFVLTEFIETRLFVKTFNFFGGPLEAAVIAAMTIYFRLGRKDFLPPSFRDWLIATAYSPLLPIYYLWHLIKNLSGKRPCSFKARVHRHAYMLMRYLGLERVIGCADGVILSHAMIEIGARRLFPATPVLGIFFPELDFDGIKKTLFSGKQLYIEVTGSITPYRQKFIDRIDSNLVFLGISNVFHRCRAISFSGSSSERASAGAVVGQSTLTPAQSSARTERRVSKGAYSLHPPQSRRWRYSSPTRIFRALQYDHNMPVLTINFNQHPIEQLCLLYEGKKTLIQMFSYFENPEQLIDYLEPRALKYMSIATEANDILITSMVAMAGGVEGNSSCHR